MDVTLAILTPPHQHLIDDHVLVAPTGTMTMTELLVSVLVVALILIGALMIWRYRRLKLRIGRSEIEYFPGRDDPVRTDGEAT